eukprot:jgi/Galph1/4889/GphlegSOOS_G3540.1
MQTKGHLAPLDSGRSFLPFHNPHLFVNGYEQPTSYSALPTTVLNTPEYHSQRFIPAVPPFQPANSLTRESNISYDGTDEQPVYVNAKQYHRILKRREARKRQLGRESFMEKKAKRPYRHESRHRHAKNRQRGLGGRFLSKSEKEATSQHRRETVESFVSKGQSDSSCASVE